MPAKDEAASLPQLVDEIARAFRPLREARGQAPTLDGFEILVVDDGSTDDTSGVLRGLLGAYPELRPIALASNVGQSAATAAGFRAALGEWVATLDADLQNDPADLARLWDALPGHDAALGWRTKREDVWSKRIISRWANRVRNAVLGQSIRDTGCSVRIFSRRMALRLPMFRGSHRFFGPLLLREGCRIVQAPVTHRPRPHGTSHYNLWNRSTRVVVDLLGVAWLMRRPIRYQVVPAAAPEESPSLPRPGRASARRPEWSGTPTFWMAIGFLGQAIFTARFLVQWVVSEKKRDSVVPVAFWWLSLFGGMTLLSYAISRRDPVIIVGQGMGLFVYIRNLMLVGKARRRAARREGRAPVEAIPTRPLPVASRTGWTPRKRGNPGVEAPLGVEDSSERVC